MEVTCSLKSKDAQTRNERGVYICMSDKRIRQKNEQKIPQIPKIQQQGENKLANKENHPAKGADPCL